MILRRLMRCLSMPGRRLRSGLIRSFGAAGVARVFIGIEWDIAEYAVVDRRDADNAARIGTAASAPPAAATDVTDATVDVPLLAELSECGRGRYRGWAIDPRTHRRWPAELRRSDRDGLTLRLSLCGGLFGQRYRLRRVAEPTMSTWPEA